jgi:hypothetical protein
MDEYNETEEEISTLIITIYSAVLIRAYSDFSTPPVTCSPSIFDQQLDDQHIRMKKLPFDKHLEYIRSDHKVDPKMAQLRGGTIIPEVALYCMLRYITGGSYSDIYFMAGISSTSFYCIIWKTISAINSCDESSVNFPQSSASSSGMGLNFCVLLVFSWQESRRF